MEREIFISYSRNDKAVVLPYVKQISEAVGRNCWIDLKGIESGVEFEEVIIKAIDECQVVLFMLSDSSLRSKWTKREVIYAEDEGKRIVPVLVDGERLRGWFKFHFGNVDFIDIRSEEQKQKLVGNLRTWLGIEEEEARRKAEEEARRIAEEEAKRKAAEEEAKRKAAEKEARRIAEEEAKRKAAEEEAKRKAAEKEARRIAEEAKRKAEEDAKRKSAEDVSKRKAAEAEITQVVMTTEDETTKPSDEKKKIPTWIQKTKQIWHSTSKPIKWMVAVALLFSAIVGSVYAYFSRIVDELGTVEGLTMVKNGWGKWGFRNDSGKIVIPCKWKDVHWFEEGLAAVLNTDGKWGFIDKTGAEAIPCEFRDTEYGFSEGLVAVEDYEAFLNAEVIAEEDSMEVVNGTWGYIDKTGKVVIPCKWLWARSFSEGLAAVCNYKDKWGFVDKTGKLIIPCQWDDIHYYGFSDGLVGVKDSTGLWGYINKTGEVVIPCQWSYGYKFIKGFAVVEDNKEKCGLIDKTGKLVIPCKWKSIFRGPDDDSVYDGYVYATDENDKDVKIVLHTPN